MKKLWFLLFLLTGLIIGYFIPRNCNSDQCILCSKSPNNQTNTVFEIDSTTADKYVRNYSPGLCGSGTGPKTGNTQAVWLSLPRLEFLICKLEAEKKQYNTDGLRLYFARYPKVNEGSITIPKDELDHNTLVFVSTKQVIIAPTDTIHWDYFTPGTSHLSAEPAAFMSPPENKGEICPPPTPCCQIGAVLTCPPGSSPLKRN